MVGNAGHFNAVAVLVFLDRNDRLLADGAAATRPQFLLSTFWQCDVDEARWGDCIHEWLKSLRDGPLPCASIFAIVFAESDLVCD